MSNLKKLGANIRSLRVAYGETQEQLGEAIFVEKNTISYYETGKREPNKETLAAIANHYMVSVEELINDDFTDIKEILIDENAIWKNIGILFPIVSSDKAIENPSFKKSFDLHKAFYDELKKVNLDVFDRFEIEDIFDGYSEAVEVNEIKAEAIANIIPVFFFIMIFIKTGPYIIKNKPAGLRQFMLRNNAVNELDDDPSLEEDVKSLQEEIDCEEMGKWLSEALKTVKHSVGLSDLADYYLALRHFFNLIDNDLGYGFNQRIGTEMMRVFAEVDNRYAVSFFKLNAKYTRFSSQTVDDK